MPAVTGADEEPSTETPDETLPEAPANTDTDPDAADATTLYTGPESPLADVPEQGPAEPEYASNWPPTDPA
jgi:hypothetical protein